CSWRCRVAGRCGRGALGVDGEASGDGAGLDRYRADAMRAGAAVRPLRRIAAAVLVAVCAAADGSAQLHHGQLRAADKGCTISATAVSFGAYDALNPSPNDSQGSISYSCGTQNGPRDKPRTPITNIQIALSPGFSRSYGGPTG